MSGVLVSVRLDAEAVAEIDGRVGSRGRSGFIRDAVAAALKPVATVPCARDKMKLLLEAVRRRAMTARDASLELGWPEILTAKVADKLFAAGLVHFPRGAGVMEAK